MCPWGGSRRHKQACRLLRQTTGVPVPSFVRLPNWPGDHSICYTARILLREARRYGTGYIFVSPPMKVVADDIPFPYNELAANRPLVYISLWVVHVLSPFPTLFPGKFPKNWEAIL